MKSAEFPLDSHKLKINNFYEWWVTRAVSLNASFFISRAKMGEQWQLKSDHRHFLRFAIHKWAQTIACIVFLFVELSVKLRSESHGGTDMPQR